MTPGRNNPSRAEGQALLAPRVFDGHRWHAGAAVLIRDERILGVAPQGEVPSDWPQTRLPAGVFLAPGFIDLQVNGGGGVLLNDQPTADGMRAIARAHRRYGTTACLPTLITDTREQMRAAITAARAIAGRDGVLGLHLEGPFISPKRPGVHRPDLIRQPGTGPHPPLKGEGRSPQRSEGERGGVAEAPQPHPGSAHSLRLADPPPAGEGKERGCLLSSPPAVPCLLQPRLGLAHAIFPGGDVGIVFQRHADVVEPFEQAHLVGGGHLECNIGAARPANGLRRKIDRERC
jgi:hypothetical protein